MIQTPKTDAVLMEDGRHVGVQALYHERKIGPFSLGYRNRISVTGDIAFDKDIKVDGSVVEVAIDPQESTVYAVGFNWISTYGKRRNDAVELHAIDLISGRANKVVLGKVSYTTFQPEILKGRDGQKPFFVEYGPYETTGYAERGVKEFRPLKVIDPRQKTRTLISKRVSGPTMYNDGEIAVIIPASEMKNLVEAGKCSKQASEALIEKDMEIVKKLNALLFKSPINQAMFRVDPSSMEDIWIEFLGIEYHLGTQDIYPRYGVAFDFSGNLKNARRIAPQDIEGRLSYLNKD